MVSWQKFDASFENVIEILCENIGTINRDLVKVAGRSGNIEMVNSIEHKLELPDLEYLLYCLLKGFVTRI